ncbi:hypothetical protein G4228_001248 [Cervus hanglu yarkandensis]|nr:hypothetical protein G4228_001248 [Cervus hanglu yarkandensis]
MDKENCAAVMDFILLGFSDVPELRIFLFLLFLSIYGATVLGNLGMIALIQVSSRLHTPMYFFLSHLSFVDFCYSTTITPKMLDRAISFLERAVQFYLFCAFVVTEVILLAVMACDCFVAICDPPLYMATMSRNLCVELVSCCYLNATVCSVIHLCLALQIPFYRSNILITILRMHSAEGRCKAFSTCASHLAAITVVQGTIHFIYCRPQYDKNNTDTNKVATVFYTVMISMLNPLIYSLRKTDVKEALRKVVSSKIFS